MTEQQKPSYSDVICALDTYTLVELHAIRDIIDQMHPRIDYSKVKLDYDYQFEYRRRLANALDRLLEIDPRLRSKRRKAGQ